MLYKMYYASDLEEGSYIKCIIINIDLVGKVFLFFKSTKLMFLAGNCFNEIERWYRAFRGRSRRGDA